MGILIHFQKTMTEINGARSLSDERLLSPPLSLLPCPPNEHRQLSALSNALSSFQLQVIVARNQNP
jgi:hypothetical protein